MQVSHFPSLLYVCPNTSPSSDPLYHWIYCILIENLKKKQTKTSIVAPFWYHAWYPQAPVKKTVMDQWIYYMLWYDTHSWMNTIPQVCKSPACFNYSFCCLSSLWDLIRSVFPKEIRMNTEKWHQLQILQRGIRATDLLPIFWQTDTRAKNSPKVNTRKVRLH